MLLISDSLIQNTIEKHRVEVGDGLLLDRVHQSVNIRVITS